MEQEVFAEKVFAEIVSESNHEIARKLRATVREFGQNNLDGAVIVWNFNSINLYPEQIGGHKFIYCPTISVATLGNVDYKVARFFEDA